MKEVWLKHVKFFWDRDWMTPEQVRQLAKASEAACRRWDPFLMHLGWRLADERPKLGKTDFLGICVSKNPRQQSYLLDGGLGTALYVDATLSHDDLVNMPKDDKVIGETCIRLVEEALDRSIPEHPLPRPLFDAAIADYRAKGYGFDWYVGKGGVAGTDLQFEVKARATGTQTKVKALFRRNRTKAPVFSKEIWFRNDGPNAFLANKFRSPRVRGLQIVFAGAPWPDEETCVDLAETDAGLRHH
jgi:hypothetical protein